VVANGQGAAPVDRRSGLRHRLPARRMAAAAMLARCGAAGL